LKRGNCRRIRQNAGHDSSFPIWMRCSRRDIPEFHRSDGTGVMPRALARSGVLVDRATSDKRDGDQSTTRHYITLGGRQFDTPSVLNDVLTALTKRRSRRIPARRVRQSGSYSGGRSFVSRQTTHYVGPPPRRRYACARVIGMRPRSGAGCASFHRAPNNV